MKKAVIDIGSNSVRYAQADIVDGELLNFYEAIEMTRLAEGFDSADRLIGSPVELTLTVCRTFYEKAVAWGAEQVLFAGTAALRKAINSQEILLPLKKLNNAFVTVLSEQQEAELNYLGAIANKDQSKHWLVFDIGGASSELVVKCNDIIETVSIPVGALTLSKDTNVRAALTQHLQTIDFTPFKNCDGILGTGGTLTTTAFIVDEIPIYAPERINGRRIPIEVLLSIYRMLHAMPLTERKHVIGLPKGRIDTIVPGLEILFDVMAAVGQNTLTISTDDGLKGLLLSEDLN